LRPWVLAVTALLLACALSLEAWLAFGTGAGVLWVSGRRNAQLLGGGGDRALRGGGIRHAILLGLGIAAGALLLGTRLNPRSPLEIQSIRAHLVEIGQAATLIVRHPLLGVGANCYTIALGRVVSPTTYAPYGVPVVHNIFLLAGAELGVVAPLLLGVLLLFPCRRIGGRSSTKTMRGCAAALAACAVLGLTDFSEWASPGFRLLWVALAALWAAEALPPAHVHRKHA
ncbi:MAG: hypothetical protein ACRDG4_02545, partial [Chloroflexota bacterium]